MQNRISPLASDVTDDQRRQLLHAFSDNGIVDAETFLIICDYERIPILDMSAAEQRRLLRDLESRALVSFLMPTRFQQLGI